jgi:hypothetical protein
MLLLAAAAIMAAPPATASQSATPTNCPRKTSYFAWQGGKPVKPQKLSELPDANLYLAVYRRVGGCEVPVVVRYRVSGR